MAQKKESVNSNFEIDPLYEEEIEIECEHGQDHKKSVIADLTDIRKMFAEILENEVTIQKDVGLINRSRTLTTLVSNSEISANVIKIPAANREVNLLNMNLPCSSMEDVYVLEKELAENMNFEIFFKNLLLEIEIYDLTGFIRSAIHSIVNEDVAIKFNWRTHKDTVTIKDFKCINILIEICWVKFSDVSKDFIKQTIQKILHSIKDKHYKRSIRQSELSWSDD